MNMADKYGMEFEHDYFDYQYWEYIDLTKNILTPKDVRVSMNVLIEDIDVDYVDNGYYYDDCDHAYEVEDVHAYPNTPILQIDEEDVDEDVFMEFTGIDKKELKELMKFVEKIAKESCENYIEDNWSDIAEDFIDY